MSVVKAPMKVPLLDLGAQYLGIRDELMAEVNAVIESQKFILGPPVASLESAIARMCGVQHGIACASGTDALLLSLKLLDLKDGDEIITTPLTFFATAGAICNAGGVPVFVDIDQETFLIDSAAVEAAVGPRSRAIVPVHLYGQMASMEDMLRIAVASHLSVIEDAAQAIGARRRIDGEWCASGALGTTGSFSFFPSKNLGGWGDGGMIVTEDGSLAERLRLLRTHGGAKQYHHEEIGTNSRLDTIQAAVLGVKLKHLAGWNTARRRNAALYDEMLADVDGIQVPITDPPNEHTFHLYTVRADRRDDLISHLNNAGVGCAAYYPQPLHLQPCFEEFGYVRGQLPEAERACTEVLSLPVYPELSEDQINFVADTVKGFYR